MDYKRRNYFIKKSNIFISDALITHIFMINYHLKILTSAPEALVNISLFKLLKQVINVSYQ